MTDEEALERVQIDFALPPTCFFGAEHPNIPGCPTPAGERCRYCKEQVLEGETGYLLCDDSVLHEECMGRHTFGSVGHQLQRCHCYGGDEEDPPGLSRHDAARAAYALWMRRSGRTLVPGVAPPVAAAKEAEDEQGVELPTPRQTEKHRDRQARVCSADGDPAEAVRGAHRGGGADRPAAVDP